MRKKLILALFSTALTVGWAVTSADPSWAGGGNANGGRRRRRWQGRRRPWCQRPQR